MQKVMTFLKRSKMRVYLCAGREVEGELRERRHRPVLALLAEGRAQGRGVLLRRGAVRRDGPGLKNHDFTNLIVIFYGNHTFEFC